MAHQMSERMQQCIDECQSCHAVCVETLNHCLERGGAHAAAAHVRALLDCAAACATSADFMRRSSPLHPGVCRVCADACEACAESCARIGPDDMMRRCIEACRRCASSCRQMYTMTA
jgi:hypothetical protein